MLTENEMKISILVWKYCCRTLTIPFVWKDGKMTLKENQHVWYNSAAVTTELLIFGCKLIALSAAVENKDVNGFILQGIFALMSIGHVLIRVNSSRYRVEMVELTNQVLYCNSAWGKLLP